MVPLTLPWGRRACAAGAAGRCRVRGASVLVATHFGFVSRMLRSRFRLRPVAPRNSLASVENLFCVSMRFSLDRYICLTYIHTHEAHFDVPFRASTPRAEESIKARGN